MMKNSLGQMPTKQVDTAMMEPKAQMSAIRNRRMRLAGGADGFGSEVGLKNASELGGPGKKAKAPEFKEGMTAEMNYRPGGFGNNLDSMNSDLLTLIKPKFAR